MNRATKDRSPAAKRFDPVTSAAQRGMVTFELAIGILAACLATALLGWGIGLVGLQARCTESAGQIARQLGRDDQQAADEARGRVPEGAAVLVSEAPTEVAVVVSVEASWGAFGPITVEGRAAAPTGGR
ncbi:MAG: TadE family type IV pilus minor pilin [Acidobacteriota bacterium]|nr:TadE family type IV pilus minor pilin [Acidobacteriota bacterium]